MRIRSRRRCRQRHQVWKVRPRTKAAFLARACSSRPSCHPRSALILCSSSVETRRHLAVRPPYAPRMLLPSSPPVLHPVPFSVEYQRSLDPNNAIISDIVSKCGFISASTKSDLSMSALFVLRLFSLALAHSCSLPSSDYTLKIKVKVSSACFPRLIYASTTLIASYALARLSLSDLSSCLLRWS